MQIANAERQQVDPELLERHVFHRDSGGLHRRPPLLPPAVALLAGLPAVDRPEFVALKAVDEEQLAVQQLPAGGLLPDPLVTAVEIAWEVSIMIYAIVKGLGPSPILSGDTTYAAVE